jgi:O-glycosyl hydrolase
VRPGYHRIEARGGKAFISAYADRDSGNFALVAVNTRNTAVGQRFTLANFPAVNSVTPWITSSALSLSNRAPVAVSNSAFVYMLPAMSVVTFAGRAM